jgi:hypothetical protein
MEEEVRGAMVRMPSGMWVEAPPAKEELKAYGGTLGDPSHKEGLLGGEGTNAVGEGPDERERSTPEGEGMNTGGEPDEGG